MFEFAWLWFVILLPLPWLLAKSRRSNTQRPRAIFMPGYELLREAGLSSEITYNTKKSSLGVYLLWLLLVLSAMRPQWIGEAVSLPLTGRDLMLAVDISDSMKMEDMEIAGDYVSRISATKSIVHEFIDQRKGDRLGLILFGSQAYVQSPLTFDTETLAILLDEARLGFAGPKTAIGDAIGLAVKRLKDKPADSMVLILLTDGNNTAGELSPLAAAELAEMAGIRIHTIGIGADSMTIQRFFMTQTINPSRELDETTLRKIAEQTGGRFFRARDGEELRDVYETINQLEAVEQEEKVFRPVTEYYFVPLFISLLIVLLAAGKYGLAIVMQKKSRHAGDDHV